MTLFPLEQLIETPEGRRRAMVVAERANIPEHHGREISVALHGFLCSLAAHACCG